MNTAVRQRLHDIRRRALSPHRTVPPPDGSPGTVRVAAGEETEVALEVNGTPVRVRVPPRRTLADTLRLDLGMTGTHLGCEHGVCGMCTVIVDGDAARSCLLFTVQMEGAKILTVEGLGAPDDQHPLQAAFAHHHALQCGFCTPGFLMSAYDLLSKRPAVTAEELPEELSGVLCRCTGYRNILTAVDAVARAYPDGVPGPRNCEQRTFGGRSGTKVSAGLLTAATAAAGGPDRLDQLDVSAPGGPPTFDVEVASALAAAPDQVWAVLEDVHLLARCLPGAEMTGEMGEGRYLGRARVALGPVRLSFEGVADIAETDPGARRLRVLAAGKDASGQTQADIRLAVEPDGSGSRLVAAADVWMAGRIAQFGRALAGDVSRRMFEQFARSVDQAATTGAPAEIPAGAPPGALRLVLQVLRDRIAALTKRLVSRRPGGR